MSLVLCSVSATALSFGARAPMRVNAPVMMSEPISALTPIGAPVSDLEGVVVPIGGAPARTVRIADLKAAGAAAVASRAELQAAYMAKAGATASVAPTQKMSIAELKAAGADAVASRFFLQTSYENKVASKACAAAEPVTEEAVVKEPVAAPEPAAAPEPVAEEPVAAAEPAAAEPAAVEAVASDSMLSSRPAYVWNPQGLTVEGLPEELKPFKDQFVTEYVTGVPSYLDGTYEGDVGFDPWGLVALGGLSPSEASSLTTAERRMAKLTGMSAEERAAALDSMRVAELKHGRLAMLAAAGWPLAELANGPAGALRATGGRAPSLFNGQLLENAPFLFVVFGGLAYLELQTKDSVKGGDYGFDPLREYTQYFPRKEMERAEIKNGRLAMMAITGMAVQEFLWGSPVVEQSAWFFGR